jgi:hypothetical protein
MANRYEDQAFVEALERAGFRLLRYRRPNEAPCYAIMTLNPFEAGIRLGRILADHPDTQECQDARFECRGHETLIYWPGLPWPQEDE